MEIKEKDVIELYESCKQLIKDSKWKQHIDIKEVRRNLGCPSSYEHIKLVEDLKDFPKLNIYNKNDRCCGAYCKSTNEISYNILYARDLEEIKNTLLHELTHFVIENCWHYITNARSTLSIKHASSWKNLAGYIGMLGNTNITTYSIATNEEIMLMYKYVAKCNVCGKLIGRARKSYLSDHPEKCHCPRCHKGTFELIKG